MKVNRNNPYGYKVCYREICEKKFITHFKTYTFYQAAQSLKSYIHFPPRAREDNHILRKPYWVIIPIKKSEVRAGIWLEDPF
jgi:hypothetical protein